MNEFAIWTPLFVLAGAIVSAIATVVVTRRRTRTSWDTALLKESGQIRRELYEREGNLQKQLDVIRNENITFRTELAGVRSEHEQCKRRLDELTRRLRRFEDANGTPT